MQALELREYRVRPGPSQGHAQGAGGADRFPLARGVDHDRSRERTFADDEQVRSLPTSGVLAQPRMLGDHEARGPLGNAEPLDRDMLGGI